MSSAIGPYHGGSRSFNGPIAIRSFTPSKSIPSRYPVSQASRSFEAFEAAPRGRCAALLLLVSQKVPATTAAGAIFLCTPRWSICISSRTLTTHFMFILPNNPKSDLFLQTFAFSTAALIFPSHARRLIRTDALHNRCGGTKRAVACFPRNFAAYSSGTDHEAIRYRNPRRNHPKPPGTSMYAPSPFKDWSYPEEKPPRKLTAGRTMRSPNANRARITPPLRATTWEQTRSFPTRRFPTRRLLSHRTGGFNRRNIGKEVRIGKSKIGRKPLT